MPGGSVDGTEGKVFAVFNILCPFRGAETIELAKDVPVDEGRVQVIWVVRGGEGTHGVDHGGCDWFLAVGHGVPPLHFVKNTINWGSACTTLV